MKLFHRTPHAEAILRDGFRARRGSCDLTGVWFSEVPLDINEGAKGPTVLVVEIPEEDIVDFEVREQGKPYREWCLPGELANRHPVSVVDDDMTGGWTEAEWHAALARMRASGSKAAIAKADEMGHRLPLLVRHGLIARAPRDEEDPE